MPRRVADLPEMNILGIRVRCLSYDEMFPLYDRWLADKSAPARSLALINVHACVSGLLDKRLRDIYNSADLVAIDGMPFLRWARMFYNRHADRFYAPDLMMEVSRAAEKKGYTFFLYGGYVDAPEKIEQYLSQRYHGVQVVGKHSPPFRELTEAEDAQVCELINDARPDFLWIGLGSPKQDLWIHQHTSKLRGCIMVPSGATFDFFSGRIRQAPLWIRQLGLEWLFRLTQDFRRLWKRYSIYNAIFMVAFALQLSNVLSFDEQGYARLFGRRSRWGNV
jgi:N-acetylglucosaminyldiphosphoundecaprenol N-acetyl-beta-D-mannosaminyltransferase